LTLTKFRVAYSFWLVKNCTVKITDDELHIILPGNRGDITLKFEDAEYSINDFIQQLEEQIIKHKKAQEAGVTI
jgi:hypothetical protein